MSRRIHLTQSNAPRNYNLRGEKKIGFRYGDGLDCAPSNNAPSGEMGGIIQGNEPQITAGINRRRVGR